MGPVNSRFLSLLLWEWKDKNRRQIYTFDHVLHQHLKACLEDAQSALAKCENSSLHSVKIYYLPTNSLFFSICFIAETALQKKKKKKKEKRKKSTHVCALILTALLANEDGAFQPESWMTLVSDRKDCLCVWNHQSNQLRMFKQTSSKGTFFVATTLNLHLNLSKCIL